MAYRYSMLTDFDESCVPDIVESSGVEAQVAQQYRKGTRFSLFAAINPVIGVVGWWLIAGNGNSETVHDFLQFFVLPFVPVGSHIMCDNLSAHKTDGVQHAIMDVDMHALYRPALP